VNQIFEGLVRVDIDGSLAPALAQSWTSTKDFKTWTFKLRAARFADSEVFENGSGRSVTAADVIFSLTRGLDVAGGSKNAWVLGAAVDGAKEFIAGTVKTVSGLSAPDGETLIVKLTVADQYFPGALTVPATYVVPPEAIAKYGSEFGTKPVGSGAFKLTTWVPGRRLILSRNDNFSVSNGVQTVEVLFFRSELQMREALQKGEIDLSPVTGADLVGVNSLDALAKQQPNMTLQSGGWIIKTHLLAINMAVGAAFADNPDARRSIGVRLRQKIAELGVTVGVGKIQHQVLPDRLRGPLAAAAPVATDSLNRLAGREVKIAFASSRVNDSIIALLKSELESAGLAVKLFPSADIGSMFASLAAVKPDLTLIYWSPYVPTLSAYVDALLTRSQPVPNFTSYSNPELDALALKLTSGVISAQQAAPLLDATLEATLPWIALYSEDPLYFVNPAVKGFKVSPVSVTNYKDVRIE